MREEQRTISALFADLVGSTVLAERLDADEVRLVIGEAIARIVGQVESLGGYVKDLAGDGVLALFGAPTSYEDDAERAARTALNIVQTITAYGFEVARGWGVEELGVRIGVSTGPVALGPIGAGERIEYAALGDTVNTAARLQAAAEPGTALVDAHTQRLIGPLFMWGEPRELELKGKAAPVRAFALGAPLPGRARLRGVGSMPTPLVGRDIEISTLRKAVEDVRSGAGGIVIITGEAGVGKSRLLADAHEELGPEGGTEPPLLWLEGRCVSYGEALPYLPFRELFRDWLGVSEGDSELRVRVALHRAMDRHLEDAAMEVYPYISSLLGLAKEDDPSAAALELTAEELQRRTFAAVGRVLERLAQDRPVVVALEDLHWADPTSTQLARALLPTVERSAVLLVMTQRDDRDHAAWGLKEAASRDFPHLVHEIALEPLPSSAERSLLHALVGVGTVPEELEHRMLGAADGNPFYLEELVRSLVDAGALVQTDGEGWRLDHDASIAIPETVEKVILARADRLEPGCHDVLTAASVVGRRFDLALLGALAGDERSLDESLHELQRLGFVVADRRWPQPGYRFKHALIQEAIYRTILSDERTRLHRKAAESLERHEAGTQEDVLALARHWSGAGALEQAIPYYRHGAELALRVFANEEAIEALTQALDLLAQAPESPRRDEEELELRIILGVPLVALRGYSSPVVGEDYSRARELCIRLGRPVTPPILRGLAIHFVVRNELAGARENGVALLAAAERDRDPMLMVEAKYVLGVNAFWAGEFSESRACLEEAIAGYAPEHHEAHVALYSQDPKVVCLSRLAWSLWFLGYPERAAATRDAALTLADQLGHPFSRCYATAFGVFVTNDLRDEPRSHELVSALVPLAADEGYRFWEMFGEVFRCWALARRGDRDAIDGMKAAIVSFEETGQTVHRLYLLALVGRAYLIAGNTAQGLDTVAEALEQTERSGARYVESELLRLRGELLRAAGAAAADIDDALVRAHETARTQGARSLELRAATELTRWRGAQGVSAQAEAMRLLEEVCSWFTEGSETPDLREARELLDARS